MNESPLLTVLRERASLQPNDVAFRFNDYENDLDATTETVTWAQLNRRTHNLALELQDHTSAGDRAVILAPQGLEYIVAFLAALQAGVIAVPLSSPLAGIHDERVTAVLGDAGPTVLLTTSAVVDSVAPYVVAGPDAPAPTVIEVDMVDLDAGTPGGVRRGEQPEIAYLQYTSGSTRSPAGVEITHANLAANWKQIVRAILPDFRMPHTVVSWLPFYHDMGLMLGLCAGILGGWPTEVMSPMSFLAQPARWMQLLARSPRPLSAAPNFAFELAAARTSDEDMAGLDLGDALYILSGAERVSEVTLARFTRRFAHFNLSESVVRPAYGLAEATLYVASQEPRATIEFERFESDELAAGRAVRCVNGTPLVSYGVPRSPSVRIVDPETATELPADTVGEIWVRGDNVSPGYWRRQAETARTFGAKISAPSPGTPADGWLRTGDLGFLCHEELFVVGRIKDLLIVRGRNHYPEDIEGTTREISGGRVAAIAVIEESTEKLVVIVEVRKSGESHEDGAERLRNVTVEVTSAISNAHGVGVEDVVLVAPGSIPITTSGKVRRASCVELYRSNGFQRLTV